MPFGMNNQHEKFRDKVKGERSEMDKPAEKMPMESNGKTEIEHKADGTKSVTHADGEKSEHPDIGHAIMAIHAKDKPGAAHLMHQHEGGVTTHQVGHDGEPQGPMEHASVEDAAESAKQTMGGDGMTEDAMMMPEHEGSYA